MRYLLLVLFFILGMVSVQAQKKSEIERRLIQSYPSAQHIVSHRHAYGYDIKFKLQGRRVWLATDLELRPIYAEEELFRSLLPASVLDSVDARIELQYILRHTDYHEDGRTEVHYYVTGNYRDYHCEYWLNSDGSIRQVYFTRQYKWVKYPMVIIIWLLIIH